MNLWRQRRLNSLLTEVGMPPKIYRGLHYTQVMEHESRELNEALYAAVKLEVQLRHRLPSSLERNGKDGGRR